MEDWWEYSLVYQVAQSGIADRWQILWHFASVWFWVPLFISALVYLKVSGQHYFSIILYVMIPILAFSTAAVFAYVFSQKGPADYEEIRLLSNNLRILNSDSEGSLPYPAAAFWASVCVLCFRTQQSRFHSKILIILMSTAAVISLMSGFFTLQFFISDVLAGIVWGITITFATRNFTSI
jgi:hypothetical protein